MFFRACVFCLLLFACADDIDSRLQGDVDKASAESGGLGSYELVEVDTPQGMPSGAATLSDVKFISKIAAGVSLLITDKNVTWRYDENRNELEELKFNGTKISPGLSGYSPAVKLYGFGKQLLQFYYHDTEGARLIVHKDNAFGMPINIEGNLYNKDKPPRLLHINPTGEADGKRPAVLIYTAGSADEQGKVKSKFVIGGPELGCIENQGGVVNISPEEVSAIISGSVNALVGGVCSDGKSFWAMTDKSSRLYTGKVTCDDKNNPSYAYTPRNYKLEITVAGKRVNGLPLGIWMDVEDHENPKISGAVVAIKDGKILISK